MARKPAPGGEAPAPIETALTRMLGLRYPILGAPMFRVAYEELAVAVSEAGGLGCLALPNYPSEESLREALARVKENCEKPVAVNLHLSGKFPWQDRLRICLQHGFTIFITSLGDPAPVVEAVRPEGGKVFSSVINSSQAESAAAGGVDGLVAVGSGAGGHGGSISTMVLVPYLVESCGIPVIAAGGIATGAQLAAALALGACGAVVGTRLVATSEAMASDEYKKAVVGAGPEDIVCTDRVTGNRASWIASSIEGIDGPPDPGSPRWSRLWSAGQSVAQAREIAGGGEVILEMAREYHRVVSSLPL